MLEQVEAYILKKPESYLGYYSKGLMLLDSYFEKEEADGIEGCSASFKRAAELIKREEIIKYYFISLLIKKDKSRIKKFAKFIDKLGMSINPYKFKLIICTIRYFKKWKPKLEEFKSCHHFDSADYLILYVLDKEYKIKILGRCNYFFESMERGRRSKGLLQGMFRLRANREEVTEELVSRYPEFFKEARDFSVFRIILEQDLISSINPRNVGLVEKIIGTQLNTEAEFGRVTLQNSVKSNEKINKKAEVLLYRYIQYCLCTAHKNIALVEHLETYLIRNLKDQIGIYLYWNEVRLAAVKQSVEKSFFIKRHFSKIELQYIRDFENQYKVRYGYKLYRLDVKVPLKRELAQLDIKFDEKNKREQFQYYMHYENYYCFKELPISIRILDGGRIIECGENGFLCKEIVILE